MFSLIKINNGRQNVPEPEFIATAGEQIYEGEGLVLSSGVLTKASGTTKPTYIAMKKTASTTSEVIPCFRITPNMVFEVPVNFSSTPEALVLGTKVTVDTDGLGITDVTSSGVATIYNVLDANTNKTDGDKVYVCFE